MVSSNNFPSRFRVRSANINFIENYIQSRRNIEMEPRSLFGKVDDEEMTKFLLEHDLETMTTNYDTLEEYDIEISNKDKDQLYLDFVHTGIEWSPSLSVACGLLPVNTPSGKVSQYPAPSASAILARNQGNSSRDYTTRRPLSPTTSHGVAKQSKLTITTGNSSGQNKLNPTEEKDDEMKNCKEKSDTENDATTADDKKDAKFNQSPSS